MARWLSWKRIEAAAAALLDALKQDLQGRSVAVVDNSAKQLAGLQGAPIDSHDVVVRMNNGFPIAPAAQGSRFGVWCYYPLARWRALRDRLGDRPSVGAMAIDLISQATLGAVSIFGFDIKRSATFYDMSHHVG
jgi:hypothetical protein